MNIRIKVLGRSLMVLSLGCFFAQCDSADFGSSGGTKSKTKKSKNDDDTNDEDTDQDNQGDGDDVGESDGKNSNEVKVDDDSADSNAGEIFDDASLARRREVFEYGKDVKPTVVDYLFVIDNSPSMGDNVAQLQSGFASLTADLFPSKARIAVMNTMPAVPGSLSQSLNGAKQQSLAASNAEPGFMQLVSKSSIASYKAVAKAADAASFTSEGCDDAWFGADDKDTSGTRCFVAHTPISKQGGPCEAGLVSVAQFVEKSGSERVFRKGSLANGL